MRKPKKPPHGTLWKNRKFTMTTVLPDGTTEQITPAELRRRLQLSGTPREPYARFDLDNGAPLPLRYVEPDPEPLEEIEPPDLPEDE